MSDVEDDTGRALTFRARLVRVQPHILLTKMSNSVRLHRHSTEAFAGGCYFLCLFYELFIFLHLQPTFASRVHHTMSDTKPPRACTFFKRRDAPVMTSELPYGWCTA